MMIPKRKQSAEQPRRSSASPPTFWRLVLNRLAILSCALVAVCLHGLGVLFFLDHITMSSSPSKVAEIEIRQLSNMVETYYLASSPRVLPERLDDLAAGDTKLTEEVPKDPWGNPYVYVYTGERDFVIFSAGDDGTAGTEDDIFEEGYR